MKDQISALEELQTVDIQIKKIEEDLEKYPKEISNFNNELESKQNSINTKKETLTEVNKVKTQLELDLKHNNENIKSSENRLFEIKTHKEYEALQKEIAETKRSNAALEEEILNKMEEIEKLESEINEDESNFTKTSEEYSQKISDNEKKIVELKADYDPIKEKKDQISAKVDPKILPIYERTVSKLGNALSLAENEKCTTCHINIPAQMFNEILKQTRIILCPSCKRILYARPLENTETTEAQ